MQSTPVRSRSISPTRTPKTSNLLQRNSTADGLLSLFFTKTDPGIFDLKPIKKQEQTTFESVYTPNFTEVKYGSRNLPKKTYQFEQVGTKKPLFSNYHRSGGKCEGISSFFIEHMLHSSYKGIEQAATDYKHALLLEPSTLQEIQSFFQSCCGVRDYEYSREDSSSMSFINYQAYENIENLDFNPELLLNHCKEVGKLSCYDSNLSEQIQKVLTIMMVNNLDKMFIKLAMVNLDVKVGHHMLAICIFKCKAEEGTGYWVIPNDPNEKPYIPLKVQSEDVTNSRLHFNNLLKSWVKPFFGDVPRTISLTCFIAKDDPSPANWYTSHLALELKNPGENNGGIFTFIVSTFVASIEGKDVGLAKHAVEMYNNLSLEQSRGLDINNQGLNGERTVLVDGKPTVKENWGAFFLIKAIEYKLHDVAKVLIEELGVDVNSRGVTSFSQVNSLDTSLTTPLTNAILKKDAVMVNLLVNKYDADPLYPVEDPAYTSARTKREIQDILVKKCANLKLDSEGYLKLIA